MALTDLLIFAWLFIPTIVLAGIVYLLSQNKKTAFKAGLAAFSLSVLTAILSFWSDYLTEHALAHLNPEGVPDHLSRNGWALVIEAFPLWGVPSLLASLVAMGILMYRSKSTVTEPAKPTPATEALPSVENLPAGIDTQHLTLQLEIETLKRELDIVKQQKSGRKETTPDFERHRADRFKQEMAKVIKQNTEYELKIRVLQTELDQAHETTSRLVDENNELKHLLPPDHDNDDES